MFILVPEVREGRVHKVVGREQLRLDNRAIIVTRVLEVLEVLVAGAALALVETGGIAWV